LPCSKVTEIIYVLILRSFIKCTEHIKGDGKIIKVQNVLVIRAIYRTRIFAKITKFVIRMLKLIFSQAN